MRHGEKKVAKIVEELTMFFFSVGANLIESSIKRDGDYGTIHFCADYNQEYRGNLHYLEKYLNQERNEALEDIYWELVGSSEPGESSQLLLIGTMIDKADINITDEKVELTLYKQITEY